MNLNKNHYRYSPPYYVATLGECKDEYFNLIKEWYLDAWGKLRVDQEPAYTVNLLNTRLSKTALPITYLVFDETSPDMPVGTFTLTHNMIGIGDPNITMFNNLYVNPDCRNKGIAKIIAKFAENIALQEFNITCLQLGTTELGLQQYYEKLGWHFSSQCQLGKYTVILMQKNITCAKMQSLEDNQ